MFKTRIIFLCLLVLLMLVGCQKEAQPLPPAVSAPSSASSSSLVPEEPVVIEPVYMDWPFFTDTTLTGKNKTLKLQNPAENPLSIRFLFYSGEEDQLLTDSGAIPPGGSANWEPAKSLPNGTHSIRVVLRAEAENGQGNELEQTFTLTLS